ncbi:ATP-binding cassette domain-containing protein, partial [Methylococcus capsulatus]
MFSGLNLTLSPGQLLQVEGANGAGKTSLLRVLAGLS